jgi:glutamate-ammonia-ligase adenylyltransferase
VTEAGSPSISADLGAQVDFRHPHIAAQNLARVGERVSGSGLRTLVQLLAESPDPDTSLNLFERLTANAGAEAFRLLERHQNLLHYAVAVLGYSHYLGETLIQNPDLFQVLLREKNLHLTHSRDEYAEIFARFRSRSLDTDTSLLLARFKRREYVRIMLRDVLRIARLAETTAEISALADVLIEEALRDADMRLRNRYGAPQTLDRDGRLVVVPFAVLSLGKLGGNELNYSSDIDLLFLHGDGEAPPEAAISNHEYFVRLAQQVTEILSRVTREGAPFRIDLRLRPQGGEGEPAVGLSHALEYYQHRAGDWELQAMIKLRHSAGDQALAREFIRRAQPFIYTEQLNFAAIETATQARERIGQRRRRMAVTRRARQIDVKLDRGGIRDIEFLVQCLQRVYGGTELWLRSGGTMFSLQKLHDKGHISGKEFHDLTTAYEFLRTLEHRLQLRHGQQTHRLPIDAYELRVLERMVIPLPGDIAIQTSADSLAAEVGRRFTPAGTQTAGIVEMVRGRMSAVAEIYGRIIHQQQVHQQREDPEFRLRSLGDSRENGHRQLLERLAIDAPAVYELAQRPDLDAQTRRNLYRFLAAAFTTSERYAAVAHSPEAMKRAVEVFAVSDYLTDLLIRHPEQIAMLQDIATVEPSPSAAGNPAACRAHIDSAPLFARVDEDEGGAGDRIFSYVAASTASYGEKMALLRQHYQERLFASGARDVMEGRSVWDAMAETTAAADQAISAALAVAEPPVEFAVLALGRLGTREHDLLSDADLLFVREEATDGSEARRAAERMVELLSAYTRDGAVFPVDARLRPHGGEGELVITPAKLETYGVREGQPWEALTYTKLRCVAGDRQLAAKALAAADVMMRRFAADREFAAGVRAMRARLEKTDAEPDNLKTGPGGLYDLDFLVGSQLVRHGIGQTRGNLRQRLASLRDRGLLDPEDTRKLQCHAELLRAAEHAIRLVTGRARKTLPAAGPAQAACEQLCARMLNREFPEGLEITLRFALVGVREIFERVLAV